MREISSGFFAVIILHMTRETIHPFPTSKGNGWKAQFISHRHVKRLVVEWIVFIISLFYLGIQKNFFTSFGFSSLDVTTTCSISRSGHNPNMDCFVVVIALKSNYLIVMTNKKLSGKILILLILYFRVYLSF